LFEKQRDLHVTCDTVAVTKYFGCSLDPEVVNCGYLALFLQGSGVGVRK
jgi:hypothetical protein